MGTIKDRNSKHLTKAEEIKKRCQEYKKELHTKEVLTTKTAKWYGHSSRVRHPGV